MFPYDMNDRIDSLEEKSQLNCVFAMFRSINYKGSRKRTWKRTKSIIDESVSERKAAEFCDLLTKILMFPMLG